MEQFDAVVLGGGFYGCCIALLLSQHYDKVALIEKENRLLQKASSVNQARVHGGYHYPRSFVTATRSLANYSRFLNDFKNAIIDNVDHIYAIAKYGSKTNAKQFFNLFKKIGAPIQNASNTLTNKLFNSDLIDEAFIVNEAIFDWEILEKLLLNKLAETNVTLFLNTEIKRVTSFNEHLIAHENSNACYHSGKIFSCLYANLNTLQKNSDLSILPLKYELAELALIEPLQILENRAITIMDGHFFSLLPYPQRELYTLSHVRYTPHLEWIDTKKFNSLNLKNTITNFMYMKQDSIRYMPSLKEMKHVDSLYEIKTILQRNENDDGRPILFREEPTLQNFYTIMGGKIDNIYDALDFVFEKSIVKSDYAL